MLRAIILLPLLAVLIVFAVSNPQTVTLALWPTTLSIAAPLAVAVLAIGAIFFLFGAVVVWVPALGTRLRARRAERRLSRLERKLATRSKSTLAAAS